MKAVLLAGGLGTRIRPFSFSIPKPLLPVGHKPILEILLHSLREQGVREVILAVGYRADLIRAYVMQCKIPGLRIHFVEEKKRMGTAGPLRLAKIHIKKSESFLAMNSDILTRLPYRRLWSFHHKIHADVTVVVRNYNYRLPYGVMKTDGIWLKSILEKPKLSFVISLGIYCIRRSALAWLPPKPYVDMPDFLLTILRKGGRVAVFPFRGRWKAIEELGDFRDVNPEEWQKIRS